MTEQELAAVEAGKTKKTRKPKEETSYGTAIELGDMTEQGIKAADNLCSSFYNAFNARMENNLAAIRNSVAQKSILIPSAQKALPLSEGSFLDALPASAWLGDDDDED